MANTGKVHADLVRSTRSDADFQIAEALEGLEQAVFGQRLAARRKLRSHSDPPHRIARDGCCDPSLRPGPAVNQRQIDLFYFSRLELRGERMMGTIGPGHYERPAGFAIETMYDAWTEIPINF